jgi:hypothetical protein
MAPKGPWPIYPKKHILVKDRVVQNTVQNIKQRKESTANKTRRGGHEGGMKGCFLAFLKQETYKEKRENVVLNLLLLVAGYHPKPFIRNLSYSLSVSVSVSIPATQILP